LIFTPLLSGQLLAVWPFLDQAGPLAFSVLVLIATMLVIAIGEFVPEAMALRNAEESAISFAPLVALLEWVLGRSSGCSGLWCGCCSGSRMSWRVLWRVSGCRL